MLAACSIYDIWTPLVKLSFNVLGLTSISLLVFHHFGFERRTCAKQYHMGTSALSRHIELDSIVFVFHSVVIMQEMDFVVNRLFCADPCIEQSAQQYCGRPGVQFVGNRQRRK